MTNTEYRVKREIDDVEFSETAVDEIREDVKKEMVEEGQTNLSEDEIEERVEEKLIEIARSTTEYDQADHCLIRDIDIVGIEEN